MCPIWYPVSDMQVNVTSFQTVLQVYTGASTVQESISKLKLKAINGGAQNNSYPYAAWFLQAVAQYHNKR